MPMAPSTGAATSRTTRETRLRAALKSASERSEQAQRAGRVGTFDLDLVTGTHFWSDVILEIYGVTREEFDGSIAAWVELLHPDDRATTMESWQAAIDSGAVRWVREFRMRCKDGSVRWLRSDAGIIRDAAGQAVRSVGINLDVTVEKMREHDLAQAREAAEAAAQRVVEITDRIPGIVFEFVRSADGHYSTPFVSEGCEPVLGIPREDVIADVGITFRQIHTEDLPG